MSNWPVSVRVINQNTRKNTAMIAVRYGNKSATRHCQIVERTGPIIFKGFVLDHDREVLAEVQAASKALDHRLQAAGVKNRPAPFTTQMLFNWQPGPNEGYNAFMSLQLELARAAINRQQDMLDNALARLAERKAKQMKLARNLAALAI